MATGIYELQAIAGAATVTTVAEPSEALTLNYTLGGLTGVTLAANDTKLVIDADDVTSAVGDAESYTLVFDLSVSKGSGSYTLDWTAESLSELIPFKGTLGELLKNPETKYTMVDAASPALLADELPGLVPSVVYGMNNGVLSSITINVASIPEPTTATLSLLALAGLAARRRRR